MVAKSMLMMHYLSPKRWRVTLIEVFLVPVPRKLRRTQGTGSKPRFTSLDFVGGANLKFW